MDLKIKGKTAMVTGGSKGIGAGCSIALAQEGCNLIINYRSSARDAEDFADKLSREYGIKAVAIKTDVSIEDEVHKLFEEAFKYFSSLDILINNAAGGFQGFIDKAVGFHELTTEQWRAVQEGTLNSAFFVARTFAKYCIEGKHPGSIVNVLSKSALLSSSKNNCPYVSAKGGLLALTRGMAKDLIAYDIRVNGIVPGYVKTERNYTDNNPRTEDKKKLLPTGEFATPYEMGTVAAFLCSDLSYQIIGAVIDCTGGTLI